MNDDEQAAILREIRDVLRQQASIDKDRWEQYLAYVAKERADWENRQATWDESMNRWKRAMLTWSTSVIVIAAIVGYLTSKF